MPDVACRAVMVALTLLCRLGAGLTFVCLLRSGLTSGETDLKWWGGPRQLPQAGFGLASSVGYVSVQLNYLKRITRPCQFKTEDRRFPRSEYR